MRGIFLRLFQWKQQVVLYEIILFVVLRLKFKEFIGLILKLQSHLKNKGRAKSGPLFPWKNKVLRQSVHCKEWHHFWTATTKLGSRLDFFLGSTSLQFFSSGSVRLCLHSLDRVYKYRENGRQNKVSNFISSKNIVRLSSSDLTVLSQFLTAGWKTQPMLHHYTVAQEVRNWQPFIKSDPLSWSIKRENKTKVKHES